MGVRIEIRRENQIVDVLPIGDQPLLFGRHGDCDYPLKDSLVSGQHLKVWSEKRVVYAEDLDSRNGTKKNGRRIQSGVRFRMRNSEVRPDRRHHPEGHQPAGHGGHGPSSSPRSRTSS